jgi:hypothetical protein
MGTVQPLLYGIACLFVEEDEVNAVPQHNAKCHKQYKGTNSVNESSNTETGKQVKQEFGPGGIGEFNGDSRRSQPEECKDNNQVKYPVPELKADIRFPWIFDLVKLIGDQMPFS